MITPINYQACSESAICHFSDDGLWSLKQDWNTICKFYRFLWPS